MGDEERDAGADAWIEHCWPDLSIRGRFPPFLYPIPFREGDRRGLFLASDRDDWREFVALSRLSGHMGEETTEAWRTEAERLTTAPNWIGVIVVGPYPVEIDGVKGEQGWLRFRDPRGQELMGLLWVGKVDDGRVMIAYWCEVARSRRFVARYRRILESIRWMRE
jgi:hypothetical protein